MKNKVVINDTSKLVADDVISSFKDFNEVINKYEKQSTYNKWRQRIIVAGLLGLLTALILLFLSRPATLTQSTNRLPSTEVEGFVGPDTTTADTISYVPTIDSLDQPEKETKPTVLKKVVKPVVEDIYTDAYPLNGYEHLYAFLNENIKYPDSLGRYNSVQVKVKFTIAKDSTIQKVRVVKSKGAEFDKEAIRLIKSMPKWVPATNNQTQEASWFVIPVRFEYDSSNHE